MARRSLTVRKGPGMEKVKIAGAQIDVRLGDVSHNRDTIIGRIREAANMSAALVVFPECALQGFCFNSLDETAAVAESREGLSAQKISEVCGQEVIHAVYGYIEESGRQVLQFGDPDRSRRTGGQLQEGTRAVCRRRAVPGAGRPPLPGPLPALWKGGNQYLL